MEDPWGNAWTTPKSGEEHDVAGSTDAPNWNTGFRWNDNTAEDDTWGSSSFASIGAALGTNGATAELKKDDTPVQSPVHSEPETHDPWGTGQTFDEQPRSRTPSPPSHDLSSLPTSPTHESYPEDPTPDSQSEDVDESDPWGAGSSTVPFSSSESPFGIPAVKLDDAFPVVDSGHLYQDDAAGMCLSRQDANTADNPQVFEPPPPLPTSLDDVPSINHEPPDIPNHDEWGHDNAWGPPVAPTDSKLDEQAEQTEDDEWSRAVTARRKQDALVVCC